MEITVGNVDTVVESYSTVLSESGSEDQTGGNVLVVSSLFSAVSNLSSIDDLVSILSLLIIIALVLDCMNGSFATCVQTTSNLVDILSGLQNWSSEALQDNAPRLVES